MAFSLHITHSCCRFWTRWSLNDRSPVSKLCAAFLQRLEGSTWLASTLSPSNSVRIQSPDLRKLEQDLEWRFYAEIYFRSEGCGKLRALNHSFKRLVHNILDFGAYVFVTEERFVSQAAKKFMKKQLTYFLINKLCFISATYFPVTHRSVDFVAILSSVRCNSGRAYSVPKCFKTQRSDYKRYGDWYRYTRLNL